MTESPLIRALDELTEVQRSAVDWGGGPLLVLAGPGSGKTQVLTCRIARLLDTSRDKNFRVLALTFTNKAADEMKGRVANFVPGLEDRANIGTFHSFCGQILRQHGVHIGIKPDFVIYALDDDRKAVLEDALRRAASVGQPVGPDDDRYLGLIDRMKARLIEPDNCENILTRFSDANRIAVAYKYYESELRRINALDFNSLILEGYKLAVAFPAIAARYRKSHPFWLIDEFQDTNNAQYRLIKALAGAEFKNIFAVADDDQIIYQWNGASFQNIQSFLTEFSAELIQLPTNYRCPPAIVEAANRLVVYNAQRTRAKQPLIAGKTKLKLPPEQHIQLREFASEEDEAQGIATEINQKGKASWAHIAILGRNRALLERMFSALQKEHVSAVIAQRRADFLSPQLRWLVALLTQTIRPLDRRNFLVLVEAFNRMADTQMSADQLTAEAEASGQGYLTAWLAAASAGSADAWASVLGNVASLMAHPSSARTVVDEMIRAFQAEMQENEAPSDLAEDLAAWREVLGEINRYLGRNAPLEQVLQELQLRSKEASPKPDTVTLMTVHGAKGREFELVYVIGMAEDILPSYQSRLKGDKSPEMEEERRNCFVAITRAKECLILSRAERYRGWIKPPSRFLVEMELAA